MNYSELLYIYIRNVKRDMLYYDLYILDEYHNMYELYSE